MDAFLKTEAGFALAIMWVTIFAVGFVVAKKFGWKVGAVIGLEAGVLVKGVALHDTGLSILFDMAAAVFLLMAAWGAVRIFFAGGGSEKSNEERLRGAKLVKVEELAKLTTDKSKKSVQAKLGDVPIPIQIEPQHFLFVGGTGTGKSLAFNQLMETARGRKQKAIVIDLNGSALAKFGRDDDHILNPFDSRSQSWSPFAEIEGDWEVDGIVKSMIPDGSGSEKEWNLFSQNVVSAVMRSLHKQGRGTNQNLYHALIIEKQNLLAEMVAGSPAQRLFEKGAEKMLQSVLGIVSSYFSSYQYLADGEDAFSIKQWMQKDDDSWLFINVRDDQLDALRPLISAWLDIGIRALLSGESTGQTSGRRVWFFMDELASYGRVQSIESLLTKARKFGGVAVGGLQAVSQLQKHYGQHDAQTILSCFSSQLFLRQVSPEMGRYAEAGLADAEVKRQMVSENQGEQSSTTTSHQYLQKKLVLASEFQNLPDREGYLNLAGNFPITKVIMPIPQDSQQIMEPFVLKSR